MNTLCAHLTTIYYKPCNESNSSQQISCAVNNTTCSSVCEKCDKFSARQFWQAPPKTVYDFLNQEENKSIKNYTTQRKSAWTPAYPQPVVHNSMVGVTETKKGCRSCGGHKNYTK
jgi:hypothetical protein